MLGAMPGDEGHSQPNLNIEISLKIREDPLLGSPSSLEAPRTPERARFQPPLILLISISFHFKMEETKVQIKKKLEEQLPRAFRSESELARLTT